MTTPCHWGYTGKFWEKQVSWLFALESHWALFFPPLQEHMSFTLLEHQGRTWQGLGVRCIKSSCAWLLFTLCFVPDICMNILSGCRGKPLLFSFPGTLLGEGYSLLHRVQLLLFFWYSLHLLLENIYFKPKELNMHIMNPPGMRFGLLSVFLNSTVFRLRVYSYVLIDSAFILGALSHRCWHKCAEWLTYCLGSLRHWSLWCLLNYTGDHAAFWRGSVAVSVFL